MTRQLQIVVDGPVFVGHGHRVHGLMFAAGLRPTFNGVQGGWVADTKRLPDFVAYLDHRNIRYAIEGAEPRKGPEAGTHVPRTPGDATPQPDLFGGEPW